MVRGFFFLLKVVCKVGDQDTLSQLWRDLVWWGKGGGGGEV